MFQVFLFIGAMLVFAFINNKKQPQVSSVYLLQCKHESTPFSHKKQPDRYWEALVRLVNGDRNTAWKMAQALREGLPMTINPLWREQHPASIDVFFDKLFLDYIMYDPQLLSQLGLFESLGIRDHNVYLNDVSVEALLRRVEKAKEHLIHLKKYPCESLSHDQNVSHRIFSWMLEHAGAGEQFLFHEYRINQMDGILMQLTLLFTQYHKLETVDDIENYIVRLNKIPEQIRQTIHFFELQESKGIFPPRFTVEKVIEIIKGLLSGRIDKNIFYAYLEKQVDRLGLSNRRNFLEKALHVIQDDVYPALQLLKGYFVQLLDKAKANNGVWALPHGLQYYAYMLKHYTTTDMSADEMHALGLQEVDRIHQEMRQLLAQIGIVNQNKQVGCLMLELAKNPQFYYSNDDEGRKQCLADYEAILARSRKELGCLFGITPKAAVTIQRVPLHDEENTEAYYSPPTVDGLRPGVFFVNLRNMREVPKYGMETLTIHEAGPGHHFQCALQNEMNCPMLRKLGVYDGYCEGWALYAEKLADEYGFYSSPFSRLGHLQDELLRAARLVADTGIHHKRWTREQALAYMEETTGYHANILVDEVEGYFLFPGQACSYKIGELKILALRQRAKDTLGSKFNIKEFHDVILGSGAVPLTILEEIVDDYVKAKS